MENKDEKNTFNVLGNEVPIPETTLGANLRQNPNLMDSSLGSRLMEEIRKKHEDKITSMLNPWNFYIPRENNFIYEKTDDNYYLIKKDYWIYTGITSEIPYSFDTNVKKYTPNGMLLLKYGNCWDGASGPAIDTESFMRASAVHDALYYLMRAGQIDSSKRIQADRLMKRICIEDGMSRFRANYCYFFVRLFGGKFAKEIED